MGSWLPPAECSFPPSQERGMYACRQQTQGLLPQGTNFDLFRGTAQGARDEVERYPTQVS